MPEKNPNSFTFIGILQYAIQQRIIISVKLNAASSSATCIEYFKNAYFCIIYIY
jgi:hypothetical protein